MNPRGGTEGTEVARRWGSHSDANRSVTRSTSAQPSERISMALEPCCCIESLRLTAVGLAAHVVSSESG
jgi:hypothetical protein